MSRRHPEFDPLQSLLIRHEQVLFAQAQQSAGCNPSHTVEARMCRWLLRMRDLTQSNELNAAAEPGHRVFFCPACKMLSPAQDEALGGLFVAMPGPSPTHTYTRRGTQPA